MPVVFSKPECPGDRWLPDTTGLADTQASAETKSPAPFALRRLLAGSFVLPWALLGPG